MAEDKEVLGRLTGSISLSIAVDATVVFLSAEGAKECSPGFLCRPALNGYAIDCWTTQEAQDPINQA